MSRVGSKPVIVPDGVTIKLANQALTAKGKLGELSMSIVNQVDINHADDQIVITPKAESKAARAMWGIFGHFRFNFLCETTCRRLLEASRAIFGHFRSIFLKKIMT